MVNDSFDSESVWSLDPWYEGCERKTHKQISYHSVVSDVLVSAGARGLAAGSFRSFQAFLFLRSPSKLVHMAFFFHPAEFLLKIIVF